MELAAIPQSKGALMGQFAAWVRRTTAGGGRRAVMAKGQRLRLLSAMALSMARVAVRSPCAIINSPPHHAMIIAMVVRDDNDHRPRALRHFMGQQ